MTDTFTDFCTLEYDVVYINNIHNIQWAFITTETEGCVTRTLKIRQIEPE